MWNHSVFPEKRVIFPIMFLLPLLAISCHPVNPPAIAWSKTFLGDGSGDGRSVQQTEDGGFILAGTTYRSSDGRQRIYVVRTDGDGNAIWAHTFGGPDTNYGQFRTWSGTAWPTVEGGFVVAGAVSWSDGGGNDHADVYVIRTDANGDTLWTRRYCQGTFPYVNSVQQTADGDFVVAFGNSANESSARLLRLDSLGDSLWLKSYGSDVSFATGAARQTADAGFILATTLVSGSTGWHACLVKTDANGGKVWSYVSTAAGQTLANDVWQTSDSGYVTVGQEHIVGLWANTHDIYVMKVSVNGQLQWERNFGPRNVQEGQAITQTSDGGYLIGGVTGNDVGNMPCAVKTDAKGNPVWSDTLGESDGQIHAVCESTDGGYVLAGSGPFGALLVKLNPSAQ